MFSVSNTVASSAATPTNPWQSFWAQVSAAYARPTMTGYDLNSSRYIAKREGLKPGNTNRTLVWGTTKQEGPKATSTGFVSLGSGAFDVQTIASRKKRGGFFDRLASTFKRL